MFLVCVSPITKPIARYYLVWAPHAILSALVAISLLFSAWPADITLLAFATLRKALASAC